MLDVEQIWAHLVLHVLVAELQLHDVLEGSEQRLVKVEVRKLRPAGQHLRQDIVDEGHGLLGYMALLVAGRLGEGEIFTASAIFFMDYIFVHNYLK